MTLKAEYITHSGSDLLVVNAARVSFDKNHEKFDPEKDTKLIKYLAKNGHIIPFAHPSITLRITAPVFVRTQAFKHKIGFVESEISRRYVTDLPEFYQPEFWRPKAPNKKQGSLEEAHSETSNIDEVYQVLLSRIQRDYQWMLDMGVSPEQARMILPQSMITSWYWTGSLLAYSRFYNLRKTEDAQYEIRELARVVSEVIQPLFPVSWLNLTYQS